MADMERLYREYYSFIYKFLLTICKNESISDELTSETFFRAYINLKQLKNDEKAPVWLCSIAKNLYFSHCKKAGRLCELPNETVSDEDVSETVANKILSENAMKCVMELDEPYKEVFMLCVFGDLSLKEISTMFGKSESWARVTFYRAKQKIIERMNG